jgi:Skp family chaperone for outer membrane proteins
MPDWLGRRRLGLTGALIWGAWTGLALAQAPPPAPTPVYGPPIAGVCLFGENQALAQSQAGVIAAQQITQFAQGIDAELKAQGGAILSDDRALAKQKAQLPAAEYGQRVTQLRQRYADLDATKKMRTAQLDLTRRQARAQLTAVLNPSLAETITARRCGMVIDKASVYGATEAMDITGAVIQRMDGRLATIALRLATPEAVRAAQSSAR